MADRKITDLTALAAGSQATGDLLTIVDVSEAAATDKNKKITVESLFKGIPGDVGIGTASADQKLSVQGLISTKDAGGTTRGLVGSPSWDTSYIAIQNGTLAQSAGNAALYQNNTGITSLNSASGNSLNFKIGNGERARIDSSGRLLVGTTADKSISSDANALVQIFTSSAGKLLIGRSDASVVANDVLGIIDFHTFDGGSQRGARIAAVADGDHASGDVPSRIEFSTCADGSSTLTERLRIDSSGNVIVGTSSTVNPTLRILGSSAHNSFIQFADGDSNNVGQFQYSHSSNALITAVNGSERMRINSSGNVGIGETAPDVKLHINGGSDNTIVKIESSDAGARIRLTDIHASSSIEQNSNELILSSDTNSADGSSTITFKVDNSEKARLDSSGRLMVGTTSPGSSTADDLTIAKTGDVGISIRSGTSSRGNIYFADGTSGNDQFRGYIQYDHSGNYLRFATNAVERMRILSGGGITFNGDTAQANALDDYEEGTFTCTFSNADNNVVGSGLSETAYYIKIGHLVHFNVYFNSMTITSTGTSTAGRIRGLPFTARNVSENYAVVNFAYNSAFTSSSGGYVNVNDTTIIPVNDGTTTVSTISTFSGKKIMITGTYYAA